MKVVGQNHQSVSTSYNNIGFMYVSLNKYKKAYEYFDKSYKVCKYVFGDDNICTKDAYNEMKKYENFK